MKRLKYHYERLYPQVLTDPSLKNLEEKILYCHILSFELEGKNCFTFDHTLGERIGKTAIETREILQDLERRRRIRMVYQPGITARILRTTRIPEQETEQSLIDVFDISQENKI